MKNFRELQVWRKAHELTLAVYQLTNTLPRQELYGLSSQLRRASSSIGANLAEGCGRNSGAELGRYCSIAMGSASELEYHLLLANDLKLIRSAEYQTAARQTCEVKLMLGGLLRQLKAKPKPR